MLRIYEDRRNASHEQQRQEKGIHVLFEESAILAGCQ
jgi:hypothetical protein